jgi:hypothetical protein
VLQGLAELGRLGNVKLVSGVSGGGAALAYFYAHRDQLLSSHNGKPWAGFYDAVSQEFIVRCLRGSAEHRIAGGVRLGTLLDEGFEDHFFGGREPTIGGNKIGLLFNISVAGEVHQPRSSNINMAQWAEENPKSAKSWASGSRLVISNVIEAQQLKGIHEVSRDGLRYISLVHPDTKLSTSAALNANFPPVFSNAAVDLDDQRYWVTDGGATDNRGVITLLYVLREALKAQLIKQENSRAAKLRSDGADSTNVLTDRESNHAAGFVYPEIHIIVADASATTFDYSSKRGFGAVSGASRKLASGLIGELSENVQAIYGKIHGQGKPKIHFYNLAMPLPMRSRGGLGTHWMMPLMANFKSCTKAVAKEDESVTLTRNQIVRAIAGMHQPHGEDNIGALIMQDPFPLGNILLRNGDKLAKLKQWYLNDAAYHRGFGFRDEPESDEDVGIGDDAKDTNPRGHRDVWLAIDLALRKRPQS